ncbi:unnamed protein product [Rhizophagus irregularis]|nr:unnamed protein product [Rhizophagus irregularis]CAB5295020.1 unnamed protein product [Rhizophagus irregularis]
MTIEELHNKISRLKKATYITAYALTFIGKACVPGIPPIVIAVNPSDKTEKAEINMHDNNERIKSCGTMAYFDGAIHDRNWFGEV